MRRIEGFGDLNAQFQQFREPERLALDVAAQGFTVDKFHGDERAPVLLADVIEGADAGMIENGNGAGFAAKALQRLRVTDQIFGQEFQRNRAVQAGVERFVDHTHSSGAEPFGDAKVGDVLVNHCRDAVIGTGCRRPGWDTGIAIVERTLPKLAAGANATPAGAIPRIGPAGTFRKKEPAEACETGMLLKTLDFKGDYAFHTERC